MLIPTPATTNNSTLPAVSLNGTTLEPVNSYKYLGIELTSSLSWDAQWARVQKQTSTVPFLIKTLRRLGFPEATLINVYRSLALSHFIYSAPLLSSSSIRAKTEMQSYQNRILRIINITPTNAASKYNIKTIEELLDYTNSNTLKRILADEHHPLTTKTPYTQSNHQSKLSFQNKQSKNKSILQQQKYIRTIRDGVSDLYSTHNKSQPIPTSTSSKPSNITIPPEAPIPNRTTAKITCSICGKNYAKGAGIAIHLKSCRNKQALLTNNRNSNTT